MREAVSARCARRQPDDSFRERRGTASVDSDASRRDDQPITFELLLERIDGLIDQNSVVLVDTCLASFPGADLRITGKSSYICQPVWLSIGYLGGAMLGASCALGDHRILGVTGDGGFQTTAQAFSSLARRGRPAILFVLNNGLYGIEQYLLDPTSFDKRRKPLAFNALNPWKYADVARAMGGVGYEVRTESQLDSVLAAIATAKGAVLVDVHLDPHDLPSEISPGPSGPSLLLPVQKTARDRSEGLLIMRVVRALPSLINALAMGKLCPPGDKPTGSTERPANGAKGGANEGQVASRPRPLLLMFGCRECVRIAIGRVG